MNRGKYIPRFKRINKSCSNKNSNNPPQGGQSTPVNSTDANCTIENGTHLQPQSHGDASEAFPFQFGSISPGFMNGMAIPPRTGSSPPNIDEQMSDQAHHDSFRSVPSGPTPPVPKQQKPPRKDTGVVTHQSNAGETHIRTKGRKDPQVSASTPAGLSQKPSVVSVSGISMPMSYHQSPQSLQFGGTNPQIQSQGMSTASLQMPLPIPIPIGNAQVQQQFFIPGLQSHPMLHQGIMHQGHNMSFTPPTSHPLSHQLGNMGIGISRQYPQQHGGKFATPRKTTTVKITHPETHEELRLDIKTDVYSDGRTSDVRSQPNMPFQSQPVHSLAASHPMNYYSSSLNTSSLYRPPPSSLLPTSGQIIPNSQPPRFNYPLSHGSQNADFMNSLSLDSPPVNKVKTISKKKKKRKEILQKADVFLSRNDNVLTNGTVSENSGMSDPQSADLPETTSIHVKDSSENAGSDSLSLPVSGDKDKTSEPNKVKTTSKGKKKRKEILQKADAAWSTSDLYNAFKGPEKKKEAVNDSTSGSFKQLPAVAAQLGAVACEKCGESKAEPDDWEDAADMYLPKLQVADISQQVSDESVGTAKKYSRDFLLKFSKHCADLPEDFEVWAYIAEALMSTNISSVRIIEHDSHPKVKTISKKKKKRKEILQKADVFLSRNDNVLTNATVSENSGMSDPQSADLSETTSIHVKYSSENAGCDSFSLPVSGNKDKTSEPNKVKTTSKGKKKRKEILQKADAARSTSDLYNAFKGPEKKKEAVNDSTSGSFKQLPAVAAQLGAVASEKCGESKAEPDDWEDAADMYLPKLQVADISQQVSDESVGTAKKYSRDFLLKFSKHCADLPEDFEVWAYIAEALMSTNISSVRIIERDSHPNPGRIVDRPGGMSRMDRRGSGMIEEDKKYGVSGAFHSGHGLDGIGGNTGFQAGQGGNFGVLRNPRSQTPLQYAGGILSGPMQSMENQDGMQRNSPGGERLQRSASSQQRGLIPLPTTPQIPLQMMHKAETKYEVGKIPDEEQAKQRQLKAILNKLTPQNFERLFEQVKAVNIDNAVTLTGVISQIFEKALMEPTFCEMYANFCLHLASELPDFSEDNEKITFKRLLLNKCQEEFERGEREQEEANKADEGEVKQWDEEREERRVKARRLMLGNIKLIGELYKKRMMTERVMHEYIKKLQGQYQDPDDEDIETLCKLMSTIGEMIDHPKAKDHIDAHFKRIKVLSNNINLSSRVRFMLKDVIDLRKNKWQHRRKVEGPKGIEEVHRDAVQERQAEAGRTGRGPDNNTSLRRNPTDFGPRGSSMLSSPNAQMGGLHGLPTQVRGYGSQDTRFEERQSSDARTLSVPLPQRLFGDDSITMRPQGGLASGMSIRGSTAEDSHIMATDLNGYSSLPERPPYSSREDLASRFVVDRFSGPGTSDQSSTLESNINYGNRDLKNVDQTLDRPVATSSPAQLQASTVSQIASSEKVWPEVRLRDMSMEAIREYYSARDYKEVALCIKDLNSPSFHPSMVSLWVTDSFERKDAERDLLAKLLVILVKSQYGTLSKAHLVKGFESVLNTLEDAVNDAPRAAEFLGRIFAKVVTDSVVTLNEIGRLIHDGGEEPGSLLEAGLSADVLGWTLESIQLEKGEAVLREIRTNSNLRLETFRPPNPITSKKLEKFI